MDDEEVEHTGYPVQPNNVDTRSSHAEILTVRREAYCFTRGERGGGGKRREEGLEKQCNVEGDKG